MYVHTTIQVSHKMAQLAIPAIDFVRLTELAAANPP